MKLELRSLLIALVVASLLFPFTVSIRIGALPLITLPRILILLCYTWIFCRKDISNRFLYAVRTIEYNGIVIAYLVVCLYTAVLKKDINTFFGFFVDAFLFYYLLVFMLKEYVHIKDVIKITTVCMCVVCALGVIEYATGFNIFTEFVIGNKEGAIPVSTRDGLLRIRGPYGHALAYGMVLLLLFPLTCYDSDEKTVNLFKNKILLFLAVLNILFTGARSGIGLFGLEIFLLYCFTDKAYRGNATLMAIGGVVALVFVMFFFSNTPLINYCLRQIFYAIDAIFNTNFALAYGGNASIVDSSIARDRIWKILQSAALNPWLGRGVSNIGEYVVDGWLVTSIDNFYVKTYISLGLPGMITLIGIFLQTLILNLRSAWKNKMSFNLLCAVATLVYALNLLYADELSTFRYFFIILAIGQDFEIERIDYGDKEWLYE